MHTPHYRLYNGKRLVAEGSSYWVLSSFAEMQRSAKPPRDEFYHASRIADINAGKYDYPNNQWAIREVF